MWPTFDMSTLKQELVASKIVENHGNISKAMIQAGYSPATAKNPKNLTESKAWPMLIERYIPDNEILQAHWEALKATKQDGMVKVPDHQVRLRAVELAYKIKGRMKEKDEENLPDLIFDLYGKLSQDNQSTTRIE